MKLDRKDVLLRYQEAFTTLNVDRSRGREAPHKPIMLLAVMDLIETGRIAKNQIALEPELLERFRAYFDIVRSDGDRVAPLLPFFHLRGDKFWHHRPAAGMNEAYRAMRDPGGKAAFVKTVDFAYLDEQLFGLLCDPQDREVLRQTIITRYFSAHAPAIADMLSQEAPLSRYENYLRNSVLEKNVGTEPPHVDDLVRDRAFSRVVRAAYDYRCAACGLRVILDDGTVLVEAAHIIPLNVSNDNDPRNGIALCRNHHWAMDVYLVAPVPANPRPVWRVSGDLDERIEGHAELISFRGKPLLTPRDHRFSPREDTLRWRRDNTRERCMGAE